MQLSNKIVAYSIEPDLMRLIDVSTLRVEELFDDDIPQYAALSHTWGSQEVTFQEMTNVTAPIRKKSGYENIERFCDQALKDGFRYCWIDTCSIDKSSSAEL